MSRSVAGAEGHMSISVVTLVAGLLVVAGSVLAATVDMVFLLVFGAGVFGPGALREMGILKDQDEFQREASRASGYRAYLAAGLFLSVWLAVAQRGSTGLNSALAISMGGTLILLVVVWLLSALLTYWGARRAVSRILLAFGSFWLVFTGLSHATEPVAVLLEARLAAPFFVLAWTARRWPRSTGALLVLVALYVFFAFDLYQSFTTRMDAWPVLLTTFLPLTACGLALLGAGRANAREEAGSRAPESTHLGERSARLEKRGD
jgi:hypothetical protein